MVDQVGSKRFVVVETDFRGEFCGICGSYSDKSKAEDAVKAFNEGFENECEGGVYIVVEAITR